MFWCNIHCTPVLKMSPAVQTDSSDKIYKQRTYLGRHVDSYPCLTVIPNCFNVVVDPFKQIELIYGWSTRLYLLGFFFFFFLFKSVKFLYCLEQYCYFSAILKPTSYLQVYSYVVRIEPKLILGQNMMCTCNQIHIYKKWINI